jgi:hypothetical protein
MAEVFFFAVYLKTLLTINNILKPTSLSEADFRKRYGNIVTKSVARKALNKDRHYFDSGDHALSKAGKAECPLGNKIPSPEVITSQVRRKPSQLQVEHLSQES